MKRERIIPICLGLIIFFFFLLLGLLADTCGGLFKFLIIVLNFNFDLLIPRSFTQIKNSIGLSTIVFAIIGAAVGLLSWNNIRIALMTTSAAKGELGNPSESRAFSDMTDDSNNFVLTKHSKMALVTHGHTIKQPLSNRNALLVGVSGTGKTTSFYMPNLLRLHGQSDVFLTDTKGDFGREAQTILEARGYEVHVFDLKTMTGSWATILSDLETDSDIDTFAKTLMDNTGGKQTTGDRHWEDKALEYVKMLLSLMRDWYPNDMTIDKLLELASLDGGAGDDTSYVSRLGMIFSELRNGIKLVSNGGSHTHAGSSYIRSTMVDRYGRDLPEDGLANRLYHDIRPGETTEKDVSRALRLWDSYMQAPPRERGSILSTVSRHLDLFDNAQLRKMFRQNCHDTIELKKLGMSDTPQAIIAILSDKDKAFYPIFCLAMAQAISVMLSQADSNGGRLNRPVVMYLDEFANLGHIDGISNLLSVIRSRDIFAMLSCQGLEVMRANYSKEEIQSIIEQVGTLIWFGGNAGASAKQISEMTGHSAAVDKSFQTGTHGSIHIGNRDIPTISIEEITSKMSQHDALVIPTNNDPYIDEKAFSEPEWQRALRKH